MIDSFNTSQTDICGASTCPNNRKKGGMHTVIHCFAQGKKRISRLRHLTSSLFLSNSVRVAGWHFICCLVLFWTSNPIFFCGLSSRSLSVSRWPQRKDLNWQATEQQPLGRTSPRLLWSILTERETEREKQGRERERNRAERERERERE